MSERIDSTPASTNKTSRCGDEPLIFLHDEARVTIEDAARLLGRSGGEIAAAIE
jgi:hypothetical protein